MYVRLAFSVAAHMEPDILIVDEVLAVGDTEFQKKCLGKMDEITKKEGRTILFVSHNMAAIEQLCTKVILLKNGQISDAGPTKKIVSEYLNSVIRLGEKEIILPEKKSNATFLKISMQNEKGDVTNQFRQNEKFFVNLDFKVLNEILGTDVSVSFRNSSGVEMVFSSLSDAQNGKLENFNPGNYSLKVEFDGGFLMPDDYYLRISIHHPGTENIDTREDIMGFNITENKGPRTLNYGRGCVSLPNRWIK